MATYYVDPAATGANDGSSWANAFTNLQSAVTAVTGTDNIIYARGTQTLTSGGTASIDFASAASGALGAWNKIIGCNASGEVDGSYFTLDGDNTNGTGAPGIFWRTSSYWWIENVHCTRCQGDGFGGASASAAGWAVIHCKASSNGTVGFNGSSVSNSYRILAFNLAESNNGGFWNLRGATNFFSVAKNNTSIGFRGYAESYYGCISQGNSATGFTLYGGQIYHCVSDDNGVNATHDGILLEYSFTCAVGCRSTNNYGYGVGTHSSHLGLAMYNFCVDNITGQLESTAVNFIGNVISGAQGYVDRTNGDFNLTADAIMRRVPITLPS